MNKKSTAGLTLETLKDLNHAELQHYAMYHHDEAFKEESMRLLLLKQHHMGYQEGYEDGHDGNENVYEQ